MSHALNLQDGTLIAESIPGVGITRLYFTAAPSNGGSGYMPGCLGILINSAWTEATTWYFNTGTTASATWTAFDPNLTENAYLSGLTPGVGAASKALVLDSNGSLGLPAAGTFTLNRYSSRIGGLAYTNVADSTAVTSTSTETFFDTFATIAANTLQTGSVIKLRYAVIPTSAANSDTLIVKSYLASNTTAGSIAGVTLATSSTTDATSNDILEGEVVCTIRTLGSSGTVVAAGSVGKVEAASGTATRVSVLLNSTSINTQTATFVGLSGKWSTADTADSIVCRFISVEVI